jgi:hypothetical protein
VPAERCWKKVGQKTKIKGNRKKRKMVSAP